MRHTYKKYKLLDLHVLQSLGLIKVLGLIEFLGLIESLRLTESKFEINFWSVSDYF